MSQTGDTQVFPGGFRYADDYIFMPLQGASQWDSLAHVYYDDTLYNGFPAKGVTVVGAEHCSIDKIAKGVAGTDVQVAQFINRLGRSSLLRDVNLVIVDEFPIEQEHFRKFQLEMMLNPDADVKNTTAATTQPFNSASAVVPLEK